jgi:hypothetical protein
MKAILGLTRCLYFFSIFCLYTMETMLSLAFGIKNNTQKDPKNPYSESARAFFQFDFLFILTSA